MKGLIRRYILTVLCLWIVTKVFPGALQFTTNFDTGIFATAGVIMLLDVFVRPLINVILLPLNFITLGAFRFVALVAVFWLADYFLKDFSIQSFSTMAFTIRNFNVPSFAFNGLWAYVGIALFINLIMSFILWLFK